MSTDIDFHELRNVISTCRVPGEIAFATLSGAHLYGFPDEDSDFDIRAVHMGDIGEVLGLYGAADTWENNDGLHDIVSHEFGKFCRLLAKSNANCLEQVFSPHVIWDPLMLLDELKSACKPLICKKIWRHYDGFWRQQAKRYSEKSWKRLRQLLYGYRVLLTGIHMMHTGHVEANLRVLNVGMYHSRIADDLIAMKQSGESEVDDDMASMAMEEHNELARILEHAAQSSHLPREPDVGPLSLLLIGYRLSDAHERYQESYGCTYKISERRSQ
jgi:predicted nucleotidyltransferase